MLFKQTGSKTKTPKEVKPKVAKGQSKIALAPQPEPAVISEPESTTATPTPVTPAGTRSMIMSTLNLVRSTADRKSKRIVIYNIEGRTGSVQFLSTLFGGDQKSEGNPPASLTLSGEFAEPKPKAAPRVKETPEERKARLAAMPKLTLAEKVAKAEKKAAALRAKLAKASEPVATPA